MALKEKDIWPKWPVHVSEDGKILFPNPKQWDDFKVPYYGKDMTLILKKRVKERSRQEEKYYHAVVVRLVAETLEMGRQEAHEFLKAMFLRIEDTTSTGIRYSRIMSTTELSDQAYREYWEKCVKWAALPTMDDGLSEQSGLGIYVPYPNEVDYESTV